MALRDLLIKISADGLEVDRELQRSSRSIKRFGRDLQGVGQQLTIGLTVPLAAAGYGMLETASGAQELGAKFQAVFREMAPEVEAWAGQTAEALGRSSTELEGFLARLQDTFVPLGFSRRAAADYSKSLTALALDVAAFNDMADAEVLRDFTSAVVGNQEAVRKYGIILTQTALKAELLRMGVANSVQEATEQEKVQARVNIILQATADAQGTAAREADGFAAGQKSLVAALRDTAEVLGQDLLPLANELQRSITGQIRDVGGLSESSRRWVLSLGIVAASLGPVITGLGLLTIAAGTLASTLSVGLLPIVAVGGPLVLGLGAVAALWVKMKLDATNATGSIDDFARSLRGLTRDQLLHQQAVATIKLFETDDQLVAERLILQGVAISEALAALKDSVADAGGGDPVGESKVSEILTGVEEALRVSRELARATEGAFSGDSAGDRGNRALSARARAFRLAREEAEILAKAIRELVQAGLSFDSEAVQGLEARRRDAVLRSLPDIGRATEFGGFAIEPLREIPEILSLVSDRTQHVIQRTSEWALELGQLREVGLGFANAFAGTLVDAMANGREAFARFRDLVLRGLAEILAKLALFNVAKALFGVASPITSFFGQAFGFTGAAAAGQVGVGLGTALAPASVAAPATGASIRLDLSGMPPAADPRQAARDATWLRFLYDSQRALSARGG